MHNFRKVRLHRLSLFLVCLVALCASRLDASLLSTATVTLGGPCSGTLTVTGTSTASASLPCTNNGGASASANSSFAVSASPLSTFSFSESAATQDVATSTASFNYELVVTGGTGTGFLVLNLDYNISGNKDAQSSANSAFTETLNGSALNSGTLCLGPIAVAGPFSCNSTVPIGFGFTYGLPFELSLAVTGTAGGGLAAASIEGTTVLTWAAITTGGSLPNPNAGLSIVPEPSPAALCSLSVAALCAILRRRRLYVS